MQPFRTLARFGKKFYSNTSLLANIANGSATFTKSCINDPFSFIDLNFENNWCNMYIFLLVDFQSNRRCRKIFCPYTPLCTHGPVQEMNKKYWNISKMILQRKCEHKKLKVSSLQPSRILARFGKKFYSNTSLLVNIVNGSATYQKLQNDPFSFIDLNYQRN